MVIPNQRSVLVGDCFFGGHRSSFLRAIFCKGEQVKIVGRRSDAVFLVRCKVDVPLPLHAHVVMVMSRNLPRRLRSAARSYGLAKYLESELNLAGRRLRRSDQFGVADRTPRRIKDISIVEWRSEIRAVENIEEFRSKLHIEGVGNSFDVIVLEY